MNHPFEPQIFEGSKNIIVGSLPPEGVDFFYSNSHNTRMWDILLAIKDALPIVPSSSFRLTRITKVEILATLGLSMFDIIYKYERKNKTTADSDIIPLEYHDIRKLISNTDIENIIFVYESAAKWFLHSLKNKTPLPLNELNESIDKTKSPFYIFENNKKTIKCFLVPSPLSRGVKGMTLEKKREIYERHIFK